MEHRQFRMLRTFPGFCLPFTSCLLTYNLAPSLPRFGGNCGSVYILLGWALVKLFELALDIITAKLNLSLATIWMSGVEKEHAHKGKVSKQANSRTDARCYLWALNGQLLQLLMKGERFKTKLCKQFEAAVVVNVLYARLFLARKNISGIMLLAVFVIHRRIMYQMSGRPMIMNSLFR